MVKHGRYKSPEWTACSNMLQRCTNPNCPDFKRWGSKGITVCGQWRGAHGFETFLADVGPRPSPEFTLDRKDNTKGYEPTNVRWATRKTQNRNTSKNANLTVNGTTKTLAEWCELTGVPHSTLRDRLRKLHWTPEEAVGVPPRSRG